MLLKNIIYALQADKLESEVKKVYQTTHSMYKNMSRPWIPESLEDLDFSDEPGIVDMVCRKPVRNPNSFRYEEDEMTLRIMQAIQDTGFGFYIVHNTVHIKLYCDFTTHLYGFLIECKDAILFLPLPKGFIQEDGLITLGVHDTRSFKTGLLAEVVLQKRMNLIRNELAQMDREVFFKYDHIPVYAQILNPTIAMNNKLKPFYNRYIKLFPDAEKFLSNMSPDECYDEKYLQGCGKLTITQKIIESFRHFMKEDKNFTPSEMGYAANVLLESVQKQCQEHDNSVRVIHK